MGTLSLTNGEAYTFGKVNNSAVITAATDYASADLTVRQDLKLLGHRSRLTISASSGVGRVSNSARPQFIIGSTAGTGVNFNQGACMSYIINSSDEPHGGAQTIEQRDLNLILANRDVTSNTIAGLGFITSIEVADADAMGAAIYSRRDSSAGSSAAAHASQLCFATNISDDDDLFEALRILPNGRLVVSASSDGNDHIKLTSADANKNLNIGINDGSGYDGTIKLSNTGLDISTDSFVRPIRFLPDNATDNQKVEIQPSHMGECMRVTTNVAGTGDLIYLKNANSSGRATIKFDINGTQGFEVGTRNANLDPGYNFYIYKNGTDNGYRMLINNKEIKFPTITQFNNSGTTVRCDGNGRLNGGSSQRHLKKDIVDLPQFDINSLRPVSYGWKHRHHTEYGFIVEEVAEIDPNLTIWLPPEENHPTPEKELVPKDVDDRAIIAILVQKVQELEARLKKLEK